MDLNKVPSDCDYMVNAAKMEGKPLMTNLETSINYLEVEKICREVEEKGLDLQIRHKEMKLEEINENIRVLEGRRVGIEEEIKGLRKHKANFEGTDIVEAVTGELSLDEWNEDRGSDIECKIDQLIIENQVLECEKGIAIREVEEWRGKCKEFELRVHELEERLSCRGEYDIVTPVKEDIKDVNVGGSSYFGTETCSYGVDRVVDGGIRIEGTSSKGKQVKRQLAFCNAKICEHKIAPSTPAGERPSSAAVIDVNSDHELDDSTAEEDEIDGKVNDFVVKTPKRKRDLTVVNSDDEMEENEGIPKRRAFKITNSDNEGEKEDDDALPITTIFNRVKSKCHSDDDDNIPISQLRMKHAQVLRRSERLQCRNASAQSSDDLSSLSPSRRRLAQRGQSSQSNRTQKTKKCPDSLRKMYFEDEDIEDGDDTESDNSLSNFIVSDSDADDVEDELSENGIHHLHESEERSYDNVSFAEIISGLERRKDPNSEWVYQGDMLSDFGKCPELCLKAVCALYRRQTTREKLIKASIKRNQRGFSKFDAVRGTNLGEFLTDGDPYGDVVKTVEELQIYDPEGLEVCQSLANKYSNQLFEIYQSKKDRFFRL